jgi:hypothetical protein
LSVFKREYVIDLEKVRNDLLYNITTVEKLRYVREGKKLITSMGMRYFERDMAMLEPAIYVMMLKAPFVLQSDRILVKAENETEANKLIDNIIEKLGTSMKIEDLGKLIKRQEDEHLEFKATLRYNIEKNIEDKFLEYEALGTICAFLNTDGGILLIGVSDDKKIIGLSHDMNTLTEKRNLDGFEQLLRNLIWDRIGKTFARSSLIDISFPSIENVIICKVTVRNSDEEAYLREGKNQEFYIRVGGSSRRLSMEDANKYIKKHFKK